jgi:hypothetical protein
MVNSNMNNYKEEEIKYRLSRSTESLQDALALIAIESWKGAANRLY